MKRTPWPKGNRVTPNIRHYTPAPTPLPAKIDQVRKWWNERLEEGCQLSEVHEYHKDYDYKGESKWKEMVNTDALYGNFLKSSGQTLATHIEFIALLREVSRCELRIVSAYGTLRDAVGRIRVRPKRQYMRFETLTAHREA